MAGCSRNFAIRILNVLMRYDRPLTTNELCILTGCDRKTVYSATAQLEINGFGLEVGRIGSCRHKQNTYKFIGVHGFNEV